MSIKKDDRYFEFQTNNNTAIKTLDVVFYKDTYLLSITAVVKFQRFNTTNSTYEDIDTKTLSFSSNKIGLPSLNCALTTVLTPTLAKALRQFLFIPSSIS